MRVAIIRGDLPGPLFLADLEVISQYDPAIEPVGQTFYVSRPILADMVAALALVPAGVLGSVNMPAAALPIVINAGNRTLRVRTAAGPAPFVVCTVAIAAYATLALFLAAVNAALVAGGVAASVSLDSSGTFLALKSDAKGTGAFIEVDSIANGSTFNAVPGLAVGGALFAMPTAGVVISLLNPVGGPLDVSDATMLTSIGGGASATGLLAVRDAVSQHLIETQVVIQSLQVGNLGKYASASYCPDHNRLPAGAAVTVVQDDGVTPYAAPLPAIAAAVIGGGNLTITGVGLGTNEVLGTSIKVTGAIQKTLSQAAIKHVGGTISSTQIVLPLTMLPGLAVATCFVQLKNDSLVSNAQVVA